MSKRQAIASCESDTVMPRSAVKRKYQPEMADFHSNEPGNDGKSTVKFNDMSDHVIDVILCELPLEDLANISDTSTRLRDIASSVFLRKHAHRLISMDVFHYGINICDKLREHYKKDFPVYCEHNAMLRISAAPIWFKLLRNFGATIKHVRIHGHTTNDTYTLNVMPNLIKYVSDFCSDSLETLEALAGNQFLTFKRPLTNLREFCLFSGRFESLEALESMPNVRTLKLSRVPKTIAKFYAKLERVHLVVESDEEVQTFISFIRLNRQIKYLHLVIFHDCRPEHNDAIYSSIADNLTQLTTFKLCESNVPQLVSRHRFQGVESFSVECRGPLHMFEFNGLRKLTLRGVFAYPPNCVTIAQRYKDLKILKLPLLEEAHVNASFIQNLLKKLPELEQISVYRDKQNRWSTLKNLLGRKWEQFEKEKTGKFRPSWMPISQHFRKK
ncbi:uncharacterized protein LOC119078968 [Bradysia coprophila]|uniref:uncharacterized protein LOC119078968 n=1 Tax=Bradysia coprophila TaxID=38358 RepID=UPI00187DB23A|nr:uncharacterized protein LOC119078968 [Bradysia coprophila]